MGGMAGQGRLQRLPEATLGQWRLRRQRRLRGSVGAEARHGPLLALRRLRLRLLLRLGRLLGDLHLQLLPRSLLRREAGRGA